MTPEELEFRKAYIGSSEAAPACGLSPWRTPYELWSEKTSAEPTADSDNVRMEWGRRLEAVVLAKYREGLVDPTRLEAPCEPRVHAEYPFMRGSADALLPDRVVEIKTAGLGQAREWGEPGTDSVPLQYLIQVTHLMLVYERRKADIPVLIGGSDYRVYSVELDLELATLLVDRERAFWRCVETRTPPDVVTVKDAQARWPKDTGATVVANPDILHAVAKLHEIHDQQALLEADEDALQLAIRTCMADATTLTDSAGHPLATWKAQVRSQFDFQGFKQAHPDLYAQFLGKHPTRVFRLAKAML